MNGVELLRRIRTRDQGVACLMMTGYVSRESALETMELGIDGYVEKPFEDVGDVVARIEAMLSDQRRRNARVLRDAFQRFKLAAELMRGNDAARPEGVSVLIVSADADVTRVVEDEVQGNAESNVVLTSAQALISLREGQQTILVFDADVEPDGLVAFVREAREVSPETPILLVHRGCPLKLILKLIDLGVRAVFQKPLKRDDLASRIRRILAH
jgi:DNA-binding response OmpR family regulator